ncbi:MAG: VOC family protein [Candidatus Protistobacter heckmanni]|nr:VOC family protein [Candidatus Protistobacter heckmanni]
MKISKIHHVAYRSKNSKETVEWYCKYLNMDFQLAFAEDYVPSTKALDPYMHIFLDAGNGNVPAFFKLPTQPDMGRDENTPNWVQHIAFEVDSLQDLERAKARLEADGIAVVGVTDHTLFKSIYFFDSNGHRLELAVDTSTPELNKRAADVKWEMLEEWSRAKRAPKHAAWMHAAEMEAVKA